MICKFTYNVVLILIFPIVFVYLIIHSARIKDINFFLNKIGIILNLKNTNNICIHCASLGEINGAQYLIKKISNNNKILISTNTFSGKNRAKELFPELDIVYFPLDYKVFVSLWLNIIRVPNALIYETEIWPNFYSLCHKKNIKISVINARFSKKVLYGNAILKVLYRDALNKCSFILCKSKYEKDKYSDLKIDSNLLFHLGNLKYSFVHKDLDEKTNKNNNIFFLMASTHNPDEELFSLSINYLIKNKIPVVIAPRHISRANEIKYFFSNLNFKVEMYSTWSQKQEEKHVEEGILIIDTFGDLVSFYHEAKFVYVGGGFSERGVQNVLEPAAFGKPIIVGPNCDNILEEIKDLHINVVTDDTINSIVENYAKDINLEARGDLTKVEFLKFSRVLDDYIHFLKKEKIIN
jgi:3-deoxy-D-manno-octulosonic-acid transferase